MKNWKKTLSLAFVSTVILFPGGAHAARKNCKLTIRTLSTSGRAKVEVIETVADSREDCRLQAKDREVIKDAEETSNIRVSFSFREPKEE